MTNANYFELLQELEELTAGAVFQERGGYFISSTRISSTEFSRVVTDLLIETEPGDVIMVGTRSGTIGIKPRIKAELEQLNFNLNIKEMPAPPPPAAEPGAAQPKRDFLAGAEFVHLTTGITTTSRVDRQYARNELANYGRDFSPGVTEYSSRFGTLFILDSVVKELAAQGAEFNVRAKGVVPAGL